MGDLPDGAGPIGETEAGPETAKPARPMRPRRQMLLALLVGFVLPVGSYYVLRTLGVSPVIALLAVPG